MKCIKISERLPESGQKCLIYSNGNVTAATFNKEIESFEIDGTGFENMFADTFPLVSVKYVIHWMPIEEIDIPEYDIDNPFLFTKELLSQLTETKIAIDQISSRIGRLERALQEAVTPIEFRVFIHMEGEAKWVYLSWKSIKDNDERTGIFRLFIEKVNCEGKFLYQKPFLDCPFADMLKYGRRLEYFIEEATKELKKTTDKLNEALVKLDRDE